MDASLSRCRSVRVVLAGLLLVVLQPIAVGASPATALGTVSAAAVQATMAPETISALGERTDGANRFETNVRLSQQGWTTSDYVVIASGSNWPDALAGTSLAAAVGAPMLLCGADGLRDITGAEIQRLGATKAIILGGLNAVPRAVKDNLVSLGLDPGSIERIGGADRYETAALIAARVAEYGDGDGWVAVATGENFPDALAVSPWAGALGVPIVLVQSHGVPESTAKILADIDPTAVLVMGGERAVPAAVVKDLPPAWRIGGVDRYDTAQRMAEFASEHDFYFDNVYVARGTDWPDALSAGALGARNKGLIMLTHEDYVDNDTLEFFTWHCSGIEQIHFVGGIRAISIDVAEEILEASETHLVSDDLVLIVGQLKADLSSVASATLTFRDTALARDRVEAGKILILNRDEGLDPEHPIAQGLARRVVSVENAGGFVVAHTADAQITEFVKKGSVDIHVDPVTAQDVRDQAELVTLIESAQVAGRPVDVRAQAKWGISETLDYTFEDYRNLWTNSAGTASLDSTLVVGIKTWVDLGIYVDSFSVKAISVNVGAVEQVYAALGFTWADTLEAKEFALADIPIAYWGFEIGPIELGVSVHVKPVVGWEDVTGEFDCEFRLEQVFCGWMQMVWVPGQGTTVQKGTSSYTNVEFDAHGKATARPYVGIKVEIQFFGSPDNVIYVMPDAYLWAQAEGEFHARDNFEHTSGSFNADLKFGVECRIGYALDLLGLWSGSDYYAVDIYSKDWKFGAGYAN